MTTTSLEGAEVWLPCPRNVWRSGRVSVCRESEIVIDVDVECEDSGGPQENLSPGRRGTQAMSFPREKHHLLRRNPELFGLGALQFEDLTDVPDLHEAEVLHAVQTRYQHNQIYTCSGPILLAVNPCQPMPELYSKDVLRNFLAARASSPPHVYGIANSAFCGIADQRKSQTVLISGESGAGKTETTKFLMQFLALAGKVDAPCASSVEHQVLASNSLLEAFGNAKTLRNDNSSRFGKYIELQFSPVEARSPMRVLHIDTHTESSLPTMRLVGARIRTYLLEKVRIADQQDGERSFHIFYQVLAAAAQLPPGNQIYRMLSGGPVESASDVSRSGRPSLEDLGLSPTTSPLASPQGSEFTEPDEYEVDLSGFADHFIQDFHYLTKSSCSSLSGADEAADFHTILQAMRNVGLHGHDMSMIFRALAAVLHLGNVAFESPPKNSEASQVKGGLDGSLAVACSLLGVEARDAANAMCFRTMQAPGEQVIRKELSLAQAQEGRDALARHLYNAVFNYVVRQINESIGSQDNAMFVGLLDIFGFEFFTRNSFEQLCINFTNELLQQYFNGIIFETEQELYANEGIPWNPLEFPDNRLIVELLEKKPLGIFPMLEEECITVAGTSGTWCQKLCNQYGCKKHPNFTQTLHRPNMFIVHHFAGPVEYTADRFLDKNRDELSQDLLKCLKGSANAFIAARIKENDRLFGTQEVQTPIKSPCKSPAPCNSPSPAWKSGYPYSVASPCKSPYSVASPCKSPVGMRRMKARAYSVSREFREQLQGLMQVIKSTAPHFIRCIKPKALNSPVMFDRPLVAEQLRYQGVLQAIKMRRSGFPVRIFHRDFFRDYQFLLERLLRAHLEHQVSTTGEYEAAVTCLLEDLDNVVLQEVPNGWAVGKTRVFLRQDAMSHLSAASFRSQNRCATKLQASWKRHVRRAHYMLCRLRLIRLQARVRGVLARQKAERRRQHQAVLQVQCFARKFLLRSIFLASRRSACKIESMARMHSCRTRYLQMRACVLKLQVWWRSTKARRLLKEENARLLHDLRQTRKELDEKARPWDKLQQLTSTDLVEIRTERSLLQQDSTRLQSDSGRLRAESVHLRNRGSARKEKGSATTVMLADVGICLQCETSSYEYGSMDEFSESEEDDFEQEENGSVDDSLHDFSYTGHSLEVPIDNSWGTEGQNDPHLPPEKQDYGFWRKAVGFLTLLPAIGWLQGFRASPATTVRSW